MGIFELQSAYLKLCKFLCVVDVEIKWLFVQQVSFLIFMRVHLFGAEESLNEDEYLAVNIGRTMEYEHDCNVSVLVKLSVGCSLYIYI